MLVLIVIVGVRSVPALDELILVHFEHSTDLHPKSFLIRCLQPCHAVVIFDFTEPVNIDEPYWLSFIVVSHFISILQLLLWGQWHCDVDGHRRHEERCCKKSRIRCNRVPIEEIFCFTGLRFIIVVVQLICRRKFQLIHQRQL